MAGNSEEKAKKPRGPGRPFKKGVVNNPTGRPKVVEEFRDKCRKFVDERVLSAWQNEVLCLGDNWLKASELLAAYGYGKPAQAVDITSKGRPVVFRVDLSEGP